MNAGLWILYHKITKKAAKSLFLRICARIFRLAIFIQSTYIANTDRIGIMPCAMRANLLHRPSFMNASIKVDYKMISNAFESARSMACINLIHIKG